MKVLTRRQYLAKLISVTMVAKIYLDTSKFKNWDVGCHNLLLLWDFTFDKRWTKTLSRTAIKLCSKWRSRQYDVAKCQQRRAGVSQNNKDNWPKCEFVFPKCALATVTVWNPRRGVEPCQGLIRSFHRGKFIGCSKVREKQIKRRNIFAPASPDVRLGIVSEQIERRPAEKYEWHSRQQRRKYEIQVSPEGGEIGLIAGDKYGSRGQLAHTWLLSLGWWGLPLSPPRVWLLSGR